MRVICILLAFSILISGCTYTSVPSEPSVPLNTDETSVTETCITEATQPTEMTESTEPPLDPLEELLQSLTPEEKVGQLFLARCPDISAVDDVAKYHLGGYILFGRDFEGQTPDSLRQILSSYQSAANIPMLIAVDEEGGNVTRVSKNPAFRENRFPSPRKLYDQGGLELVLETEVEKCKLLGSLGINVNMAPVCDITTDPNAFMFQRSLGQVPEITGDYTAAVVKTMQEYRIGSVLKHFPGYGNNTDTHIAMAVDTRSLAELESIDLIPFAAGILAGCDAILISHTIVAAIDPENPATLSPEVHRYLREKMGFQGVIVTDDLVMQAITDSYGDAEAAVLAVLAGNDLLCCTNYTVQYEAVLQAVQEGRISQEILDTAVMRILRWKQNLGLFTEDS